MGEPWLLDKDAARALLGGCDPHKICPPLKLGGRNFWDRVALRRELDRLSGLATTQDKNNDAADEWLEQQAS